MTTKKTFLLSGILVSIGAFFSRAHVFAQGIVPDTCSEGICRLCDLFALADNFMDFLLTRVAFSVLIIALVYGGYKILTSGDSEDGRTKGKEAITNAVIGITIAFFAWAIVNTVLLLLVGSSNPVNPQNWYRFPGCVEPASPAPLTPDPTTPPPSTPPPTTPPPSSGGIYSHEAAVAALLPGIGISSSGNCSDPNNRRCTSLEAIPVFAIEKINELFINCNCNLVITGGTETGHASHGPRIPNVDLRFNDQNPNLLRGIQSIGYSIDAGFGRGATCEPAGGGSQSVPCNSSAARTIHLEF